MSLRDEFLELQWSQLRHDELYHKDISLLPVGDRLRHMTLHFAKYVGALSRALEANDAELFTRTLIDSFVISLACSNIMSVDLGKGFSGEAAQSIRELGRHLLATAPRPPADTLWFFRKFAQHAGHMAKACESLDHLEEINFRGILRDNAVGILRLVLVESAARDVDIVELARGRLRKVEAGNMFDGRLALLRSGAP